MARRQNNGYIGKNRWDDTNGVIGLQQHSLIRAYNKDVIYAQPNNFVSTPAPETPNLPATSSSGNGSGSLATAALSNGSVVSLILYSGGGGYTTAPTLSFSGGGGIGANGYVSAITASNQSVISVEPLYYIKSTYISNPGSGYQTVPSVSFSAPITANGVTGVTAIGSASIAGGRVTGITIHNTGSNYRGGSNYPTITFTGGNPVITALAIPILESGYGYISAPTIAVTGGGGSGSIISASIRRASISSGLANFLYFFLSQCGL